MRLDTHEYYNSIEEYAEKWLKNDKDIKLIKKLNKIPNDVNNLELIIKWLINFYNDDKKVFTSLLSPRFMQFVSDGHKFKVEINRTGFLLKLYKMTPEEHNKAKGDLLNDILSKISENQCKKIYNKINR